jgi:RND family efflux transporter MFP subunit
MTLLALGAAHAIPAGADEFVVRSLTIPELKAVFGEVKSRTVVPARARIGGTLLEVRVTEGSEVRKGEVLATVVDEKIGLELDAAEARIMEVRSQRDNAKTELDRAQQLFARGIVPQGRVDQAETQYEVAENQLSAAESAKAVLAQRAREGDILAPAAGRVLTVPVTPGSVVLPGEAVASVASGQYYLRLALPERHAAEIGEGNAVLIGRRGLGSDGAVATERRGRIAKVYPEIAEGRVIADVEVEGLGDYFVNERTLVWIPVGRRNVIAVPAAAISTRHGIDYVSIADDDGTTDVAVILGESFVDGGVRQVEVLTGLRDGDRVILP